MVHINSEFKTQDDEGVPSEHRAPTTPEVHPDHSTKNNYQGNSANGGLVSRLKRMIGLRADYTLRETIEEYVDRDQENEAIPPSVSSHEKSLIANILNLRDVNVVDIMVPRADIVAVDIDTSQENLFALLSQNQYSRIPVYQGTLDDVLGTIHIKDILAATTQGKRVIIHELLRKVPIVAPSMHVLDLLLQMRQRRKHMAMVVDEFGGIDGLITISRIIEVIVGEIEDEHVNEQQPGFVIDKDGSYQVDARLDIEEFEQRFGVSLDPEEKEDNDTLGGLVFSIAGRVPARGEVLKHRSGLVFEVLEAGPRRVNRLKITAPQHQPQPAE